MKRSEGKRIVGRYGITDFGQFHRGPGSLTGEGNVRIDDGEVITLGQADDVFIVEVMSEHTGDRVKVGEVTVVEYPIVNELDGSEAHRGHEIIGLGLGDQRAGGVHLDMRLGNHRGQVLVFWIDGESFQPIGGLGEERRMETHAHEVIAKRAGVHAVIEALNPAAGLWSVVNLMLGSASFPLCQPESEEVFLVKNVTAILGPFPDGFPAGAVNRPETAQLAELLRELRDFR
jgi:hypothetical protein